MKEKELLEKGYTWEVTKDSCQVWHGEDFIGGVGVRIPRAKPLHWRQAKKNKELFLESAIRVATGHVERIINA